MNPTQSLRRPTFTVVVQSLLWLWLIGLSVFALRGHQAINDQADQQRLEGRVIDVDHQSGTDGFRLGRAGHSDNLCDRLS